MNILTFDIEEWYLEKHFFGDRQQRYDIFDRYLHSILDLLDECGTKATFFCIGGLAREFPDVVRLIDGRGHDIGCHSDSHTWLNKMTPAECLADTHKAVDSLQQCIGRKVDSFRAPAFSIGAGNKWAFEVLAECGIEYDASIFPAVRDFGGFADFGKAVPSIVSCNGCEIKEFPICISRFLGRDLAYSGGGYFRFFPLRFVKNEMAKGEYSIAYFHIDDLIPDTSGVLSKEKYEEYFKEPGTMKARYLRYFKSNIGKRSAFGRMQDLIRSTDFLSIAQASAACDWSRAPIVRF